MVNKDIFRIYLFACFLGLLHEQYTNDEFLCYLEVLEFISKFEWINLLATGSNDTEEKQFIQLNKAKQYAIDYFENALMKINQNQLLEDVRLYYY